MTFFKINNLSTLETLTENKLIFDLDSGESLLYVETMIVYGMLN